MNFTTLNKKLIQLTQIPECGSPVISAYFDLSSDRKKLIDSFNFWESEVSTEMSGDQLLHFQQAVKTIQSCLESTQQTSGSAVIFARGGSIPFFLPLTFQAHLPTKFISGGLPSIYPLVELKDRFNRFLVVASNGASADLIELELGEKTVSRKHSIDCPSQLVDGVESLMAQRQHHSIVLAGDAKSIVALRATLPKYLRCKVVDEIIVENAQSSIDAVLDSSVTRFLKSESTKSSQAVQKLFDAVYLDEPVATSVEQTSAALKEGSARLLLISNSLNHTDRENLVRLATNRGVPIETVENSSRFENNGGAGALLNRPRSIT